MNSTAAGKYHCLFIHQIQHLQWWFQMLCCKLLYFQQYYVKTHDTNTCLYTSYICILWSVLVMKLHMITLLARGEQNHNSHGTVQQLVNITACSYTKFSTCSGGFKCYAANFFISNNNMLRPITQMIPVCILPSEMNIIPVTRS